MLPEPRNLFAGLPVATYQQETDKSFHTMVDGNPTQTGGVTGATLDSHCYS
jgi:hypothetical protein